MTNQHVWNGKPEPITEIGTGHFTQRCIKCGVLAMNTFGECRGYDEHEPLDAESSGPLPGRNVTAVQEPGKTKFVAGIQEPTRLDHLTKAADHLGQLVEHLDRAIKSGCDCSEILEPFVAIVRATEPVILDAIEAEKEGR